MLKRIFVLMGLFSVVCAVLSVNSAPAMAQRGGGGGGGSSRTGGTSNIIWYAAIPINGVTPSAVGAVNVSTYITTINLDVRLSSVDLPDNTKLTVTVYAKDYFTGQPWAPKNAGTITLGRQKGFLSVASLWVTAPRFLPVVTDVVVTKADGTVVVAGRP